jgi:hypothetical protein
MSIMLEAEEGIDSIFKRLDQAGIAKALDTSPTNLQQRNFEILTTNIAKQPFDTNSTNDLRNGPKRRKER